MKHVLLMMAALVWLLASCQQQRDVYTPDYVFRKGYTVRLVGGKALAPREAPKRIKRAIAAGRRSGHAARLPDACGGICRGGGHGRHHDSAYDCSGSVAFVLREAGMLKKGTTPVSGDFLRWGRPGYGKWLTVYVKPGHVFLIIAGARFDTTGRGRGVGPRWYTKSRRCTGFKVRHIPGF